VVGVFGHEDVRHGRVGRQPSFDQARRRSLLHHDLFAGPAAVLGPADDQHPELGRHDVEPFAHILTDPVQLIPAARAGVILDIDHHLDA